MTFNAQLKTGVKTVCELIFHAQGPKIDKTWHSIRNHLHQTNNFVFFGQTKLPLKISEHTRACLCSHMTLRPPAMSTKTGIKCIFVLLKLLTMDKDYTIRALKSHALRVRVTQTNSILRSHAETIISHAFEIPCSFSEVAS